MCEVPLPVWLISLRSRQPGEQLVADRRALADEDQGLGRLEPLGERVDLLDRVGEDGDDVPARASRSRRGGARRPGSRRGSRSRIALTSAAITRATGSDRLESWRSVDPGTAAGEARATSGRDDRPARSEAERHRRPCARKGAGSLRRFPGLEGDQSPMPSRGEPGSRPGPPMSGSHPGLPYLDIGRRQSRRASGNSVLNQFRRDSDSIRWSGSVMPSRGRCWAIRDRWVARARRARCASVSLPARCWRSRQRLQQSSAVLSPERHNVWMSRKSRGAPRSTRATILLATRSFKLSRLTSAQERVEDGSSCAERSAIWKLKTVLLPTISSNAPDLAPFPCPDFTARLKSVPDDLEAHRSRS